MNQYTNILTEKTAVVKMQYQPADRYNLARSEGEYAPKWTQKSASELTSKPAERSLEDEMMWM